MEPQITYWENGQKESETWYKNGEHHRVDRPAYQRWYKDGQKFSEHWLSNGNHHREDGPAIQRWYTDGQKETDEYYILGKYYNTIQEYANALVELGHKTKSESLFLLLKWS